MHGHFRYHSPNHAGAGISVGTNGIWVIEHSADYWGSPLVYAAILTNWTHVAVVYERGKPRLYLDGRCVHEGIPSTCVVHCSIDVPQRRVAAPFVGALGPLFHEHRALGDADVAQLMTAMPRPETAPEYPLLELSFLAQGSVEAEVWRSGRYVAATSSGRERQFEAALPPPIELKGPWQVSFAEGRGPRDGFFRASHLVERAPARRHPPLQWRGHILDYNEYSAKLAHTGPPPTPRSRRGRSDG